MPRGCPPESRRSAAVAPHRLCWPSWRDTLTEVEDAVTESTNVINLRTVSGLSDWISSYLSSRSLGVAQAQLGGFLWGKPQEYMVNSPVFSLFSVKMPLLLIHGVKDTTVAVAQSEEMFYGLQLLKREVILVEYKARDHGNFLETEDPWDRVTGWFDALLATITCHRTRRPRSFATHAMKNPASDRTFLRTTGARGQPEKGAKDFFQAAAVFQVAYSGFFARRQRGSSRSS